MTLTSEKENGFDAVKQKKIALVIDYINSNYSKELTLNAACGCSRAYTAASLQPVQKRDFKNDF